MTGSISRAGLVQALAKPSQDANSRYEIDMTGQTNVTPNFRFGSLIV